MSRPKILVTTAQYGSQMLSLGGVRHLTGGTRKEGTRTCDALLALCNKQAVTVTIDNGAAAVQYKQISLNDSCHGSGEWSVPQGWDEANFNAPHSDGVHREIRASAPCP